MTSELLKWIANGLIAVVLASTLWMAHAVRPDHDRPAALVAQVAPVPAAAEAAASAPQTATR